MKHLIQAFTFLIILTACGENLEEQIAGHWQIVGKDSTSFDFLPDGTIIMQSEELPLLLKDADFVEGAWQYEDGEVCIDLVAFPYPPHCYSPEIDGEYMTLTKVVEGYWCGGVHWSGEDTFVLASEIEDSPGFKKRRACKIADGVVVEEFIIRLRRD